MKKIIIIFAMIVLMSSFASAALTDGLVSYWDFDEGAGSTAYDSQDGNDGTLNGNPQWVTGKVGPYALDFDGSGDYVGVPDSSDWDFGSGSFTIAFWANLDAISSNYVLEHYGSSLRWAFIYDGDSWNYYDSVNGKVIEYSTVPSTGTWYHITYTKEENDYTLYIDGSSVQSNTASDVPDVDGPLYIGRYGGNLNYNYDGTLDEIGIWNRALSEGEIVTLAGGTNPLNNGDEEPAVPEFSTVGIILVLLIAGVGIAFVVKKKQ
ncbi:hypothetical protein GF336_04065 [Candidatus Woesearchaeota archaeon]|nr:hypothetical protein [Candidatus Woesearchaeota archaeon]